MGSENRREFSNGAKIGSTSNKTWRHSEGYVASLCSRRGSGKFQWRQAVCRLGAIGMNKRKRTGLERGATVARKRSRFGEKCVKITFLGGWADQWARGALTRTVTPLPMASL